MLSIKSNPSFASDVAFWPDVLRTTQSGFAEIDLHNNSCTIMGLGPPPSKTKLDFADPQTLSAAYTKEEALLHDWITLGTDSTFVWNTGKGTHIKFHINRNSNPVILNFGIEPNTNHQDYHKKDLLNSVSDIFILIAPDYKVLEINTAAFNAIKQRLNLSLNIGADVRLMVTASEIENFENHFKLAMAGEEISGIKEINLDTGIRLWTRYRYNPIAVPQGSVVAVAFSCTDITELMDKEDSLSRNSRLMAALLNGISDDVLKINLSGDITDLANSENMLSEKKQEATFTHVNELTNSHEELHNIKKQIKDTILNNRAGQVNFSGPNKTAHRYYELRMCRYSDTEALALLRDISDLKNTENELTKAKLLAEESNVLKTNLLANISHEVRTPLNGIMGLAQVIKQEYEMEPLKNYVDLQIQCCKRLLETFNNIIELSIAEFDFNSDFFKITDLAPIFTQICEDYSSKNANSNLAFIYDIEQQEEFRVWSDKKTIVKIINYLLDNSFKFTKTGSIKVRLSGTVYQNKPCACITVKDTGVGMTKEFLEKVFLPFEQESSGQKRIYEGAGVGLSIVKKYVNLLGGDTFVESKKDHGTTFYLLIPLHT